MASDQDKPIIAVVIPKPEKKPFDIKSLKTMTESELREVKVPFFEREKDLIKFIRTVINRDHDYGTCVYAMSLSAVAAFNYVCSRLGTTGFQAGCADMDFLRRTRGMKDGFSILNYHDLLFPQLIHKFRGAENHFIQKNLEGLQTRAKELLEEERSYEPHPNVKAHWEWILSVKPEGGDSSS